MRADDAIRGAAGKRLLYRGTSSVHHSERRPSAS
jgi:hypothetical protein